jgi:hypothetical protein
LIHEGKPIGRVRTLRSCRASVERELRHFERLSAGRSSEQPAGPSSPESSGDLLEKARKQVARLLTKAADPARRRAFR